MSGATCPACGVAVLPGYARCPKCRKPLPRRQTTRVEGGTAVVEETRRWPLLAVLGAAVLGVILFVVFARGGKTSQAKPAPPPPAQTTQVQQAPQQRVDTSAPPSFQDEQRPAQQRTGPDPTALASDLERDLKHQRLWSTVTVSAGKVEVRSGSCGEPAMTSMLDSAAAGFKAAGLTKLRCVEQSGRVVSDRDL